MVLHAAILFLASLWPGQSAQSVPPIAALSVEQAATHALAARPGNVIGSALVLGNHRTKYVFEIQAREGIWRVKLDANTGQVFRSCLLDNIGPHGCGPHDRHRGTHVRTATRSVVRPSDN